MVRGNIIIENAVIWGRNFSGAAGRYNAEGRRNFCVYIDDLSQVEALKEDGWNVKYRLPRDENDEPRAYLQVAINYKNLPPSLEPPKVVLLSKRGKTYLTEENINILDWAEIKNVDLTIRPYNWEVNGKGGVKAQTKSLWVTIVEDELEYKYRDVPDSALNALTEDAD